MAIPPSQLAAQGSELLPEAWDGPYHWFGNTHTSEVAHASLIGKPGAHQGKVVLWRLNNLVHGIWLWDPASPSAVGNADPAGQVTHNIFCSGHVWDRDGDLVVAGGVFDNGFNPPCSTTEPNWSFVLEPSQLAWSAPPDLLVPPPLAGERWGHYYSSLVAMHDGKVIQVGGTSAPWNKVRCGDHPQGAAYNDLSRSNEILSNVVDGNRVITRRRPWLHP